uniref:Uncharacterized protein n=1 Tax=Cacopsylla melanoneura TaxID=428564 RepID=A0A8D8QA84_9HEMI
MLGRDSGRLKPPSGLLSGRLDPPSGLLSGRLNPPSGLLSGRLDPPSGLLPPLSGLSGRFGSWPPSLSVFCCVEVPGVPPVDPPSRWWFTSVVAPLPDMARV